MLMYIASFCFSDVLDYRIVCVCVCVCSIPSHKYSQNTHEKMKA